MPLFSARDFTRKLWWCPSLWAFSPLVAVKGEEGVWKLLEWTSVSNFFKSSVLRSYDDKWLNGKLLKIMLLLWGKIILAKHFRNKSIYIPKIWLPCRFQPFCEYLKLSKIDVILWTSLEHSFIWPFFLYQLDHLILWPHICSLVYRFPSHGMISDRVWNDYVETLLANCCLSKYCMFSLENIGSGMYFWRCEGEKKVSMLKCSQNLICEMEL